MCSRLRVIAHRRRNVGGAGIRIEPAIEVGNIFKLGTRYSEPLDLVAAGARSVRCQLVVLGKEGSNERAPAGAELAVQVSRGREGRSVPLEGAAGGRPSGGGTSPGAAPPRPDWTSVRAEGMGFPTSTARPAARALASAVAVATADAGTCVLTARHLSRARCSADDRLPLRDHLLARVAVTGSDTPSNSLFGALQVAAAWDAGSRPH
jgi:hypothetical protein